MIIITIYQTIFCIFALKFWTFDEKYKKLLYNSTH